MSYELLLARRRILMASNRVWPTLLYISEAEVSMCCKDGTDGKGGVFQLHPFFDDGLDHKSQCTWTTSDASRATVNGSGLVSFSAATSYGDVTISCAYHGVTKTCLLTVYETMPTHSGWSSGLALLKGGKGRGISGSQIVDYEFSCSHSGDQSLSVYSAISFIASSSGSANSNFYQYKSGLSENRIILWQAGSGKICNRSGSPSSYTDNYFGPTISSGASVENESHVGSDGLYVNGAFYSESSSASSSVSVTDKIAMRFTNNTKKITSWSMASGSITLAQNKQKSNCIRFYIPQNYIKYTDRDTWVNYTVIPNIGTLGSAQDLDCNNVPLDWFGV